MKINSDTTSMLDNMYLNMHTNFSCKGTVSKDHSVTACFATALKTIHKKMDNTYEIFIFKNINSFNNNNYCYFTTEEINIYLSYFNEIIPFEYNLVEQEDKYILTIHINDWHFIHTFIITGVRYLYEKNYAIVLNEAMMLKKTYFFKNENILTLMSLVASSNKQLDLKMSTDMSHFMFLRVYNDDSSYARSLPTTEELQEKINEFKDKTHIKQGDGSRIKLHGFKSILNLFEIVKLKSKLKEVSIDKSYKIIDSDNRAFDQMFAKRFITYRHNYKLIKASTIAEDPRDKYNCPIRPDEYCYYPKYD